MRYMSRLTEVWHIDKPSEDASQQVPVSKSVWLERAFGVTDWRAEGYSEFDRAVGQLADSAGFLNLTQKELRKSLGTDKTSVRLGLAGMSRVHRNLRVEGDVHSDEGHSMRLVLTPERLPSPKPDVITIDPISNPKTEFCLCSKTPGQFLYLGCLHCREAVLAIVRSVYGHYWFEFESALTQRESGLSPARFDQAKVPENERGLITRSIGHMMGMTPTPRRLMWQITTIGGIFSEAYNRVIINPKYFYNHRVEIPPPSAGFTQEVEKAKLKSQGFKVCERCSEANPASSKFCSKCGLRLLS